jgi:hypothetical protein
MYPVPFRIAIIAAILGVLASVTVMSLLGATKGKGTSIDRDAKTPPAPNVIVKALQLEKLTSALTVVESVQR